MPTLIQVAGVGIAVALALPCALSAQDTTRMVRDTSTRSGSARSANVPQSPPIDFSGVLFLNYQSGGNRNERRAGPQNRFDVERAYLTFRAPAGDRVAVRVTADVFQQRDSTKDQYYRGWTVRAKYAYAQYDYIRGSGTRLKAAARLGMLHTPVVDYEEQFWPRGIAQTGPEANGFFSSSDVGFSTLLTLPNRWGELYGGVFNGAGYTSRETDRFKDYGARLTITPFGAAHGIWRTLGISPWIYKGWRASDFVNGPGSVDPITEGRQKDRYGVHVGIRDPRLTLATQLAWRRDDVESVADTLTTRFPTVTSRTGALVSAYTIVKPLALLDDAQHPNVNVILRYDRVKPDRSASSFAQFVVAGLGYDLSAKASLWVDYQNQDPRRGSTAPDIKTLFVHAIVSF